MKQIKPTRWLLPAAAALLLAAQNGSAVTVAMGLCQTSRAASYWGGTSGGINHWNNSKVVCNRVHNNSRSDTTFGAGGVQTVTDTAAHSTSFWLWVIQYETGYGYGPARNFLQGVARCDLIALMMVRSSGPAGQAHQPGEFAVMSREQQWPVWSHEHGHNMNGQHDRGACVSAGHTVMKWGYCSSGSVKEWYSNRHMGSDWGDAYRDNTYQVLTYRYWTANRR